MSSEEDKRFGSSTGSVWAASKDPFFDGTLIPPLCKGVTNGEKTYAGLKYRSIFDPMDNPNSSNNIHGYARNTHTNSQFVRRQVLELEGADPEYFASMDFNTGMTSIICMMLSLTSIGDTIISITDTYGGTSQVLRKIMKPNGRNIYLIPTDDVNALEKVVREQSPRILHIESPTNPTLKILDIKRFATVCSEVGTILSVDNTFATPINQRPLDLGADIVVHSGTKYLNGHGDALSGFAIGKIPLIRAMYDYREIMGLGLSASDCEAVSRGIRTLAIRVRQHGKNAMAIAKLCEYHPAVKRINYPGLPSHPHHAVACKQMMDQGTGKRMGDTEDPNHDAHFGGMLSFELHGGEQQVEIFLDSLKLAHLAPSLGHVETLVGPPAATSHVELTREERAELGISETLIRYSTGIEDTEDLVSDVNQALNKVEQSIRV